MPSEAQTAGTRSQNDPPRSSKARAGFDERARRAARSNCTLLLTGETGVGKGHLARLIHEHSPRYDGPFVPVNCGAIPETLIDSQLFGHARGAFTGASHDHVGLIRAAEGGTLLLDEIGELPHSAQTRLLRVLQEREVQPVGHAMPATVDVRIIAATNRDLRHAVSRGAFREDLLFRLNVIGLCVPPLRHRVAEIPEFVRLFNREFAAVYAQPQLEFDETTADVLRNYAWPGNIRELRSVIERLHVLRPGERVTVPVLLEVGLPDADTVKSSRSPSLERVRNEEVLRVLVENNGSIARTAVVFGVHRSTVYRWLRR